MPAIFSFSLGGVWPLPATTKRGTIVMLASAVPAARANCRRVIFVCFFMGDSEVSLVLRRQLGHKLHCPSNPAIQTVIIHHALGSDQHPPGHGSPGDLKRAD